jgi:hypothetical protein
VSADELTSLPTYKPANHDFMAINVKVMHLVGLWNSHWQKKRSWRYFAYFGYAFFMVFIMTVHFVSTVLELWFSWEDFRSSANTAWFVSNFGASIIKQLFILAQTDRVRSYYSQNLRVQLGKPRIPFDICPLPTA